MNNQPILYTSRYSYRGLNAFDGIKVQISRGKPKWDLPYELRVFKLLAPPYWIAWDDKFKGKYLEYLDEITFERISEGLQNISRESVGQPLVLLCFENVVAGKDCHRRHFAEWWESKTGEPVREVEEEILANLPPEITEEEPFWEQLSLL